jgi:hypothetical protein
MTNDDRGNASNQPSPITHFADILLHHPYKWCGNDKDSAQGCSKLPIGDR